jgi:hypothetical protein
MTLRPLPLVIMLGACGASDPSPQYSADAAGLDASDETPVNDAPSCTRDDGLPVANTCNGFSCVLLNTPGNCGACGVACGVDQVCARNGGAYGCRAL